MSKRKSTVLAAAAAAGAVMGLITDANADVTASAPVPPPEGDVLDSLLSDLNDGDTGEVVEEVVGEATAHSADGAGEIDDTIEEDADRIASRQAVYERQGDDPEHLFGGQPEADQPATGAQAQPTTASKPKRVKLSEEEKAERKKARDEARAAAKAKRDAEKAAQPPKAPRPTSVTHKPGDLLVAKLGSSWRELVVFTDADVADTITLERVQDQFIERMNDRDAIADKVKEKAIMLFTWLQAGGELNEVMRRAFTVLHDKGVLTSGDKGNLQLNLLSKPYSMGTARSQSNQMFMLFPELGLTVKSKGQMVENPNSVLLPMIYDRLGLTKVAGAASSEGESAASEPAGEDSQVEETAGA